MTINELFERMRYVKRFIARQRLLFLYNSFKWRERLFLRRLEVNKKSNFLVSIPSYPARDKYLPAVFYSLSRQSCLPYKWILVLYESDYPKGIPTHLKRLEKKGLEIIWTSEISGAVKAIIPTIQKYPEAKIVTFDDDIIYGKNTIEKLINKSNEFEGAVIGHIGKRLFQKNGNFAMFNRFEYGADESTKSEEVYFLKGWGTLYPSNCFSEKVFDFAAINKIVPVRGADMWFWAGAISKGTKQICLGTPPNRKQFFPIPLTEETVSLQSPVKDVMEPKFQMTIDHFGIRELLKEKLVNINNLDKMSF